MPRPEDFDFEPREDDSDEEAARKIAGGVFLWELMSAMLFGLLPALIAPALRLWFSVLGALALGPWVAGCYAGFLAVRLVPTLKAGVAGVQASTGAEKGAVVDRLEGRTPTEEVDEVERDLATVRKTMPTKPMPLLSLVVMSLLCAFYAGMETRNGGVAALVFLVTFWSPWWNARFILRSSMRKLMRMIRFADPTRSRHTPET